MHGAQQIFESCQGPAIELLRLQGGRWMDDSQLAPYAVARRAWCCDPQLVSGNVLDGFGWLECGGVWPVDPAVRNKTFKENTASNSSTYQKRSKKSDLFEME